MQRGWDVRGVALCLAATLVMLTGCHRGYYREQADAVAATLIQEKAVHPHWALPRIGIEVDPRSRMFDPFDPDFAPMPPDDPVSHELMHWVDDKPGWPGWHRNGDTPTVENPSWLAGLPLDDNGVLPLDAQQSYQLALLHSPDYQQEFEDLYLSALDVSAERFRFDTQFFGGYSAFYTASGRLRTPRSELDLSLDTAQTGRLGLTAGGVTAPSEANLLLRKGFITGADLAVGFANTLLWEFSGPDDHSALTLLDFSLIQPLLRQAGRDRILEQLTIAERALLANVRQMERYRRGFFVEVMTGTSAGQGATRRGGFFGGAGLEGFTGVGGGGFGQVGGGGFGGAAGGGFGGGGAGAAEVGGFLGLLQALQDIRNQQVTIVGLRSNLAQLNESLQESLARIPDDVETLIRERLQIAQARQALLNAESRLLNSQAAYQLRLDLFKSNLGLPPHICTYVRDPMIDQFNLIDPEVLEMQNQLTTLRGSVAVINERLLAARSGQQVPLDEQRLADLARLGQILLRIEQIQDLVRQAALAETRDQIRQLRDAVPGRRQQLLNLQQKFQQAGVEFRQYDNLDPCQMTLLADIDPAVFDVARLEAAPLQLEQEADRLETELTNFAQPLGSARQYLDRLLADRPAAVDYGEFEQQVLFAVPSMLSDLSDHVLDLSLVQARARTDIVVLTPIDLTWDTAIELARQFRRDWMNQRAALVDAWRLIEFNADNLEANLDVVMDGDLRSVGDNPTRLRDINGQIRVGLRFDAPLTRLQERNTYRQALIEYQQSRRNYYQFVDNVSATLRNTVRTIDLNQVNFEERRIAVLSAIDQVVLNDQIQKLREERGLEAGVTAARDVVSALADLQTAQNDFLSVWLNYEAQRVTLDWNLGTMNLGPDGMWIDPGPIGPVDGYPQPLGFSAEFSLDPAHEPHLLPHGPQTLERLPAPLPTPEAVE